MQERAPSFEQISDFVLSRSTSQEAVAMMQIARARPRVRDDILLAADLYALQESQPADTPQQRLVCNLPRKTPYSDLFVDPHEPHLAYIRSLLGEKGLEFPQEELPWDEPEEAN